MWGRGKDHARDPAPIRGRMAAKWHATYDDLEEPTPELLPGLTHRMQTSWRTHQLTDTLHAGLVPPNAVGSISRRHTDRVVRHQAQTPFEHCDPTASRPSLNVFECTQPGAVIVTARRAARGHYETRGGSLSAVGLRAVAYQPSAGGKTLATQTARQAQLT